MRIIDLDATNWNKGLDFYNALLAALGAPEWHSPGIGPLLESMVWMKINEVNPPYTVRIRNTAAMPAEIRNEIDLLNDYLEKDRAEFTKRNGSDAEVRIEIVP